MSTWNTTYNFNQKSLNFGQSMLYGAFGQLTGMMGGCYGGYGMGIGGYGMGMGGSLFSMMGMGGYGYGSGCCGMYSYGPTDGQVGATCGLAATSVIFQGIGESIKARRTAKAAAAQAAETASGNVETLKAKQKELSSEKTSLSQEFNIKNEVPAGIKKYFPIESDDYSAKLKTLNEIPTRTNEYYINNNAIVSGINSREYALKEGAGSAEEAKQTDLQAAIKAAKETDEQKALTALQTSFDTLTGKVKTRLEEIEREESKNNTDLIKSQKELEEVQANVKLNKKCDTPDEYKSIIGNNYDKQSGTIKNITVNDDNKKSLELAFNYKFREYCKCSSDNKEKKSELKKEAMAIYNLFNGSTTSDMDQKKAILDSGKIAFGLL